MNIKVSGSPLLIVLIVVLSACNLKKRGSENVVKYVDYPVYYNDGSLFFSQRAALTIHNNDTTIKRVGNIQANFPNGKTWIKVVYSDSSKNDSLIIFRDDGSLERITTFKDQGVSTSLFVDGNLNHTSDQIGTFKDWLVWNSSQDSTLKEFVILEDGKLSYVGLKTKRVKEMMIYKVDWRSGLLIKSKDIDFDDPSYEPDFEPDYDTGEQPFPY